MGHLKISNLERDASIGLKSADVVFLQECRIRPTITFDDEANWAGLLYPTPTRGSRAYLTEDAGIVLRKRTWEVEEVCEGHKVLYVRVRLPVPLVAGLPESAVLHLWSIHNPNVASEQRVYWAEDIPLFQQFVRPPHVRSDMIAIGADWNAVPNPTLDSLGSDGASRASTNSWDPMQSVLDSLDMVDVYRYLHPTSRAYSRYEKNRGQLTSRRLDSVWTSQPLAVAATRAFYKVTASDHAAAFIDIPSTVAAIDTGPGLWRLHPGVALSPSFQRRIQAFARESRPGGELAGVDDWVSWKERLRTVAFNVAIQVGEQHRREGSKVDAYRRQIESADLTLQTDRERFPSLMRSLRRAELLRAKNEALKYKTAFAAALWRPTAWLLTTAVPTSSAALPPLRRPDGSIATTIEGKLEVVQQYYSAFFGATVGDALEVQEAQRFLLESIQSQLPPSFVSLLDRDFSTAEFLRSITFAKDESAPGPDGLPYWLYRMVAEEVAPRLAALTNALMDGQALPAGQPALRGILLPKKGDLADLANHRPLSVADTYVRLIGRAYADRLQVSSSVIHEDQSGFLVGRAGHDTAVRLHLLLDAYSLGYLTKPTVLFSLDQMKAYDRVDQSWRQSVLQAYGVGPRFLRLLSGLSRSAQVRFTTQGFVTGHIDIKTGLLQGEPGSCLVYNLTAQPLLDFLRHYGVGVDLPWGTGGRRWPMRFVYAAFADDWLVAIADEDQLDTFLLGVRLYELASNARISQQKSCYYVLGPERDLDPAFIAKIPFQRSDANAFTYVGFPFRLDNGVPQEMIEARLSAIRRRASQLRTEHTDIIGRVNMCNAFLLSKLWHALSLCPISLLTFRQISQTLCRFLFFGDRPWVRQSVLTAPRSVGGLGLIASEDMLVALTGRVAVKYLLGDDETSIQFRLALHAYITDHCKCTPAHLLIRSGLKYNRMRGRNRAGHCFMGRVVWALCRLELGVQPKWDEYSVDDALALPWFLPIYGAPFPEPFTDYNRHKLMETGYLTWADILWYNSPTQSIRQHPIRTLPLCPPSSSAIRLQSRPCKNRNLTTRNISSAFAHAKQVWNDWFPTLPRAFLETLKTIPRYYRPVADRSTSRLNPQPHDRPFDHDPASFHLPWHLLTVAGQPIQEYTVRGARRHLQRNALSVPDWSFEATREEWARLWKLIDRLPLDSRLLSDTLLFQNRRVWLSQRPNIVEESLLDGDLDLRGNVRHTRYWLGPDRTYQESNLRGVAAEAPDVDGDGGEPSSSDDEEDEMPVRPGYRRRQGHAATAPPANPEQQRMLDALERSHAAFRRSYRVGGCLSGCDETDSAAHGFVTCKSVVRYIWRPAFSVLLRFAGGRSLPLALEHVVLGWLRLPFPGRIRLRILLWRTMVISFITKHRRAAITATIGSSAGGFTIIDWASQASDLVNELIKGLADVLFPRYEGLSDAARDNFARIWFRDATLFSADDGPLRVLAPA